MKKLFLLVSMVVLTVTAANAQMEWNLKYQGDVEVGYAVGVGGVNVSRVNFHTTHGIRFNQYLFAGVGTGIDVYDGGDLAIPLYLSLKGYYPLTSMLDAMLGFNIGESIGVSTGMPNGFLVAVPQVGIAYKLSDNKAVTFTMGYTVQKWTQNVGGFRVSMNTNAINFKVGFQF